LFIIAILIIIYATKVNNQYINYLISKILYLRYPAGTLISTISPFFFPKSAFPIGEEVDIFPKSGSDST